MLKKALIRCLDTFSGNIPLPLLQKLSRHQLLILFYHTVSDYNLPHIKHLYQIRNRKLFCKDLDYLLKYYKPIDLHQLIDHVEKNKPIPKTSIFLTFDDGLSECYHVIAPILKQKGIPATFFINSDFIDNKALMFRYKASFLIEKLKGEKNIDLLLKKHFKNYQLPYSNIKDSLLSVRWHQQALLDELALETGIEFNAFLQKQKPYLDTNQIKEMILDGFTFGSHSQNHPTYSKLNIDEQISQTLSSQEFTTNNFTLNYKVFAFPFTDAFVSKAFFERILEKEGFQLTFGGAGLKHELIKGHLQRFGMENSKLKTAQKMIHTEFCYYIIKSLFRKNIIQRD